MPSIARLKGYLRPKIFKAATPRTLKPIFKNGLIDLPHLARRGKRTATLNRFGVVIYFKGSVKGHQLTDYKNHLLKFINSFIELPKNPKQAADLITRARALLGRMKNEDIEAIDNNITFIINDFLQELKQQHGGNYKRYMATVLNTQDEFNLLKHCIKDYDFSNLGNSHTRVTMCDYFAVFGVRYVAIAHLTATTSLSKEIDDAEKIQTRIDQIQQSSDYIYLACDSINYAERLKEHEALIIKNDVLVFENKQLKDNQQEEIKKQVKKTISKKASEAGKKAHKDNYIDKRTVYKWLSDVLQTDAQYLTKYSADKIATIIDRAEIVSVTHRTICGYIKDYKDELLKKAS